MRQVNSLRSNTLSTVNLNKIKLLILLSSLLTPLTTPSIHSTKLGEILYSFYYGCWKVCGQCLSFMVWVTCLFWWVVSSVVDFPIILLFLLENQPRTEETHHPKNRHPDPGNTTSLVGSGSGPG